MKLRPDEIPVKTAEDLTDKIFGNLKVLYRVKNNGKTRGAKWRCQCLCKDNNIVDVLAGNLKNGHTLSCGCLQKQRASETHFKNLKGQKFGLLTVLERDQDYINPNGTHRVQWKCKCECGNIVVINASSLTKGLTKSCGCIGRSLGEFKIKQLLIENQIEFQ